MSIVTATDLEAAVEDAAAYLYVWALKDIPQDLRDALADAATKETSVPGQRVLQTILRKLASKGYAGPLSVELFLPKFTQGDPFEVAREIRQKSEAVMRQARVF